MYITNNINYNFLANQNSDSDLTPRVIRVETEKDRDGKVREVLVIKLLCRVDRDLLEKSNCEKIEVRLSKFDLSYYRSKSLMTQTSVAVAKIKKNQKVENQTDSGEIDDKLKARERKTKDKKRKRKNRREEKRNRKKGKRKNSRRGGTLPLFSKLQIRS